MSAVAENSVSGYNLEDLKNLQNFLFNKSADDLSEKIMTLTVKLSIFHLPLIKYFQKF